MFTGGSKYLFGLTAASLVGAVVYGLIKTGALRTITLQTMTEVRIPVAAIDELVARDRWDAPALRSAS